MNVGGLRKWNYSGVKRVYGVCKKIDLKFQDIISEDIHV